METGITKFIKMKKAILQSLFLLLSFSISWAKDNTPVVDENGYIEVNLEKEGTLKKFIKKKDFPVIKTLKLSGNVSYLDINLLLKMPNLVCLDLSEMPMRDVEKALTDRDASNRGLAQITTVQYLILTYKDNSESPWGGVTDNSIMKSYNKFMNNRREIIDDDARIICMGTTNNFNITQKRLNKITRLKIYNCFEKGKKISGLQNDTIKCNIRQGRNSVLLNEGAILYEEGLSYPSRECQVIDTYEFEANSNEDFQNAILITSRDLFVDVDTLVIPSSLRYVDNEFKRKSYSDYYKHIVFEEGDTPIDWHGAKLKNPDAVIEINRPIQFIRSGFESPVKELHFNKAVSKLEYDCFHNNNKVENVFFASVPEYELGWGVAEKLGRVVIPLGTTNAFKSKGFSASKLFERGKGGLAYNIKVEKPGTILSYLPSDKLGDIDSLTVAGYLYDTDLKIINSCSFLKYLDLTKTFITDSPETIKEQKKNAEALSGLFSLIGAAADLQYSDNNMSSMDYVYTKGMAEIVKDAVNVTQSESGCIIPYEAFSGMTELRTVKMPYRAGEIRAKAFEDCSELESVELPLYITAINHDAFNGCSSLKKISFPATLSYIGKGAFAGCNSLEIIDLGKCHFKKENDFSICYSGQRIQKVVYPEGVTRINGLAGECNHNRKEYYFPSSLEELGETNVTGCTLHFKNPNPPCKRNIKNNTIYVPKGSSTAYFTAFGSQNKYIEE